MSGMNIGLQYLYLIVLGIGVSCFSGYTKNIQKTTLELGKIFAPDNPILPTGLQDAITPSWQTRNNLIMFSLWILFFISSFVVFIWWMALIVVFLVFMIDPPFFSITIMPKPMSPKLVVKIKDNMVVRLKDYEKVGDEARAEATRVILRKFDALKI